MKKLLLALGLPAFCLSATAHAHFNLTAPPPNNMDTAGGMGSPPCGVGAASNVVTPAQGGHPLTVMIDEYVGHTGFYRIALAINSVSELPLDPVVKDAMGNILPPSGKPSGTSSTAAFEDPPVFPVIGDHLFQHTANGDQKFQMDITLPNVTCTKCTLQVLEFMTPHGFNMPNTTAKPPDTGPGGGYFYRHCADLNIMADPGLPPFAAGGAGGSSAGGTSAGGTSAGGTSAGGTSAGGTSAGGTSAGGSSVTIGGSGGGPSSAGGTGGALASGGGGGAPSFGGTSAGGAPAGNVGGTGIAGTGAATSADDGGCSFSLGRRPAGLGSLAALLGLFAFARRRSSARTLRR